MATVRYEPEDVRYDALAPGQLFRFLGDRETQCLKTASGYVRLSGEFLEFPEYDRAWQIVTRLTEIRT